MSYATANENTNSQHDVSDEFLKRLSEHLNESIDTKECTSPTRQRANEEEARRILSGIQQTSRMPSIYLNINATSSTFFSSNNIIMDYGLYKMHDIVNYDLIAGWDKMNVHECTSGSFELFTILRDSTNEIHQESWRAAVRLRLEEKLICSKKAADDLERVHESYINLRPLTNYMATPNGDYDALYRTTELFCQTTDINQTYTRLGGNIKRYIESVNGLLHIYKADDNLLDEITYGHVNCTNEFWQASTDYDRELRLYESLVIREPLLRIRKSIWFFEKYKTSGFSKALRFNEDYYFKFEDNLQLLHDAFQNIRQQIIPYITSLENGTSASKLSYARLLTADGIKEQFENYITNFIPTSQELIRKLWFDSKDLNGLNCKMCVDATRNHLLKAFFAKLYDQYNNSTPSDRIALSDYFHLSTDYSSLALKLVRGEVDNTSICVTEIEVPLEDVKYTLLRNLTSFKDMLNDAKSILETTRLDGRLFRYIIVMLTTDSLSICVHVLPSQLCAPKQPINKFV